MDFREFLTLAESLAEGVTEGEWRTAISRAYYAAFHIACDTLASLGFRVPSHSEQAHAYAWRRWSNTGEWTIDDAGRDLDRLRSDRNEADYDKNARFAASQADEAVARGQAVIAALDQLLANKELCKHVTEAIKKYERDVLKETTWRR